MGLKSSGLMEVPCYCCCRGLQGQAGKGHRRISAWTGTQSFRAEFIPEIQLSVCIDLQNRQHAQHWHADRRTSSLHFGTSLFLFKETQLLPEVTCNKLKHFQSTPSAPPLLSHHLFLYHTENHFRCHISHMAQPPFSFWASEFKNNCSTKTHNCVSPYVS